MSNGTLAASIKLIVHIIQIMKKYNSRCHTHDTQLKIKQMYNNKNVWKKNHEQILDFKLDVTITIMIFEEEETKT